MSRKTDPIDRNVVGRDPRVSDPAFFARIRKLVDDEILHQAWGCRLWTLERQGKITKEQRLAGDKYQEVFYRHRKALFSDVKIGTEGLEDKEFRLIHDAKRKFRKSQELLFALGRQGFYIRRTVHEVCVEEFAPPGERGLKWLRKGLSGLYIFYFGTKRERKNI